MKGSISSFTPSSSRRHCAGLRDFAVTVLATADARAELDPACSIGLPRYVRRELEGFMDCGILARGFLRVYCPACRQSSLVAYSCKSRVVCPSCAGRRMAEVSGQRAPARTRFSSRCRSASGC